MSRKYLKKHQVYHSERQISCDQCPKKFYFKDQLKLHIRVHTNERPYSCDRCEKTFKASNDLGEHKKTHSGKRPYACDQCTKKFISGKYLNKHKRDVHKCNQFIKTRGTSEMLGFTQLYYLQFCREAPLEKNESGNSATDLFPVSFCNSAKQKLSTVFSADKCLQLFCYSQV